MIGVALFGSAVIGWVALRDMPLPVLGALFGIGAGGMFYLVVTDLIPQAEERQFQQSGAIATGLGFLTIFVLSSLRS